MGLAFDCVKFKHFSRLLRTRGTLYHKCWLERLTVTSEIWLFALLWQTSVLSDTSARSSWESTKSNHWSLLHIVNTSTTQSRQCSQI